MMTISNIYQAPIKFSCTMLEQAGKSDYTSKTEVEQGDILVVLSSRNIPSIEQMNSYVAALAATEYMDEARFSRPSSKANYWGKDTSFDNFYEIFDQAKEEFKITKTIKGFEVLNFRTMQKLWMSHYDLTCLGLRNMIG